MAAQHASAGSPEEQPQPAPDHDVTNGSHGLSRGDRVTVSLWARSHAQLHGRLPGCWDAVLDNAAHTSSEPHGDMGAGVTAHAVVPLCVRESAMHAVLAGLRGCSDPAALFSRYEADARADFALIDSLVAPLPVTATDALQNNDERRFQVRDAAFHLRWLELIRPRSHRVPPFPGQDTPHGA